MKEFKKYILRAKALGLSRARIIPTRSVAVGQWVRFKCQYGCDEFGKHLTCPPYSPKPDETARMLKEYKKGLLIQFTNIPPAHEAGKSRDMKNAVAILEREIFLDGHYKAFGMGSGPCRFCRTCDLKKPCRYPERARPSMEACGIDVYQTVRNNGLSIDVVRCESSPCAYSGLILIE